MCFPILTGSTISQHRSSSDRMKHGKSSRSTRSNATTTLPSTNNHKNGSSSNKHKKVSSSSVKAKAAKSSLRAILRAGNPSSPVSMANSQQTGNTWTSSKSWVASRTWAAATQNRPSGKKARRPYTALWPTDSLGPQALSPA